MAYRWTLTNLSDSTTETLTKDPVKWDEATYKIVRSEKLKGAIHEYTPMLEFHCLGGGKEFIDAVYESEGVDGSILVLVEYDCDGSGVFDELYSGVLNLKGYTSNSTFATANIGNSDLLSKLINRSEISVNLQTTESIGAETITAPGTTTLPMHSMEINLENEYQTPHLTYAEMPFFTGYLYTSQDVAYNIDGTTGTPLGTKVSRYRPQFNMVVSSLGGVPIPVNDEFNDDDAEVEPIYLFTEDPLITPTPITVNYSVVFDGLFRERDGSATCSDTGVHTHNFKLILAYGPNWDDRTEVTLFDWDSTPGDDDAWTRNTGANHDETLAVNETGQVTLNNNDRIWVFFLHEAEGFAAGTSPCLLGVPFFISSEFAYQFNDTCLVTIETQSTFAETECEAVLIHEAFNQVVDAIADSDNNFYSEFYGRTDSDKQTYAEDGEGSALALTNGLNIRQIPDKKVFASFDDLFAACNALHNVGVGQVNGKIRIEKMEYFYPNTNILTLPNVPEYEIKVDSKRLYNKIETGYSKWETEVRGGLDEPCTNHEYSTAIKSAGNYSVKAPYIASSYAIELTRRKNAAFNSDLDDWRYDNDNFFISLIRAPYGNPHVPKKYSDGFTSGSNMAGLTTAYNLDLTPKRMLLAHLNNITGGLQKNQAEIVFVKGSGNTELITAKNDLGHQSDYSGASLAEDANIAYNDSNAENIAPLYLPEIYSFEYPISYTQFKAIKANPYGYVEFYKDADDVKRGYILSLEYAVKGGMTKFELLKKP